MGRSPLRLADASCALHRAGGLTTPTLVGPAHIRVVGHGFLVSWGAGRVPRCTTVGLARSRSGCGLISAGVGVVCPRGCGLAGSGCGRNRKWAWPKIRRAVARGVGAVFFFRRGGCGLRQRAWPGRKWAWPEPEVGVA